ncbi:MAG TPA: peroxiredoxin [Terriglobales bacterium]|jgi:peroxiredoxin Q/BCP
MKEGQKLPAFTGVDQNGATVRLQDFAGRPLVLYFYPRASTPGCTIEARAFRDLYPEFQRRGIAVVGVSPDSPRAQKKFCDNQNLPFPLIADADRSLCQSCGVLGEKSMFGRKYEGVVRSTFLAGADGAVLRVWSPVKIGGHAQQVLSEAERLGLSSPAEAHPSIDPSTDRPRAPLRPR